MLLPWEQVIVLHRGATTGIRLLAAFVCRLQHVVYVGYACTAVGITQYVYCAVVPLLPPISCRASPLAEPASELHVAVPCMYNRRLYKLYRSRQCTRNTPAIWRHASSAPLDRGAGTESSTAAGLRAACCTLTRPKHTRKSASLASTTPGLLTPQYCCNSSDVLSTTAVVHARSHHHSIEGIVHAHPGRSLFMYSQ